MVKVTSSKSFRDDIKLLKKQGKDLSKLYEVISLIGLGNPLPTKYSDHKLSGELKGFRDCHIENDWILIYSVEKVGDDLYIYLSSTGSHSDIFNM